MFQPSETLMTAHSKEEVKYSETGISQEHGQNGDVEF